MKWTARLTPDTDARFRRVVDRLADELGRLPSYRGRRYPDRHATLRGMLAVVEQDPAVAAAVAAAVKADLTSQETT